MSGMGRDSLGARRSLAVGERHYDYISLPAIEESGLGAISRLPVSLKILLENLARHEDGDVVGLDHIRALAGWTKSRASGDDIAFHPVRVLMPDSSGIPLLADLAAMRDAMASLGGTPRLVNPTIPLELVVDHSVTVDVAGTADALVANMEAEFQRNGERYAFLRWAQQAFDRFRVVPPGNGICHQINLESLARVVWTVGNGTREVAYPDAIIGMDSHTPMINGVGVLGWGVGGIEAATAMLGQPIALRIPEVIGCRLTGRPRPGVTTTDIVLTLTQRLRERGVVGTFVEFCGPGIDNLALPERATLANMAPEYGATTGLFPIDRETLRFLELTGRSRDQVSLVEAYAKAQGLWRDDATADPLFTDLVEIDLGAVEPSVAGPRRPQDRLPLAQVSSNFRATLSSIRPMTELETSPDSDAAAARPLAHGDVVIAALTSCTNTSNPSVMIAAGLLARKAVEKGLPCKPWVKTSLAPGSRVVADYLQAAKLQPALDALGFHLTGFGCTTCMGNSGPLAETIAQEIERKGLVVAAVLSGNRNFEGRIHPLAKTNYLAAPPLVVAYALAGSVLIELETESLGVDGDGQPVYLRDIWPSDEEIHATVDKVVSPTLYRARYGAGFSGSGGWEGLPAAAGDVFPWDPASTYIRRPPFFDGMRRDVDPVTDIRDARPLVILGDSVTTDHISPVGAIPLDGPAGRYLVASGVTPRDFNSYMARRVNHDVMVRGTFANLRLRNEMAPGTEGGLTRHMSDGAVMPVYEAAARYAEDGIPLVVVGGKDYGAGSSRDWAAKGTRLIGVRAVIAESFERIHRANLIGMGVLPLQFPDGTTRKTLGLDGSERFDIVGMAASFTLRMQVACTVIRRDGSRENIDLLVRIDTAREAAWYRNGGVLPYALRTLLSDHE